MDDRIRAAERSGDRQRLIVELHRAGKEITWQKGDMVTIKDNIGWPELEGISGRVTKTHAFDIHDKVYCYVVVDDEINKEKVRKKYHSEEIRFLICNNNGVIIYKKALIPDGC